MKKTLLAAAMIAAMSVFMLAGCSGEGARQEQTAPATTAAPQGSDAAAQTEKKVIRR